MIVKGMNWLLRGRQHQARPKKQQWCLVAFVSLVILGGAGNSTVDAETNQLLDVMHHVYVENQHVGSLDSEEQYKRLVDELFLPYEKLHSKQTLHIGEKVEIIPESVFESNANSEKTLKTLSETLSVKAEAVALVVEQENIVYLPTEEKAEQTVKQFILQYVDEKEYELYLERQNDHEVESLALEVGEQKITDVSLTKEVSFKQVLANPKEILSNQQARKLLNFGVLEEQLYEVREGDVLGSIANNHSLTTAQLLDLNPDLIEESVLHIGQTLHVTAYKPVVEVLVKEMKKVKEAIPFEIEVIEDESMWKGEQKVKQEGEKGVKVNDYQITWKNGKKIDRLLKAEEIIREPVTKIILKGTKEMPSRGTGNLGWPAVGGYISSQQGTRWGRFHRGIDIARPSNYDILAADNGVITFAENNGGYGNMIRINHNNGMETLYAHLRSIDVSVGQTVTKGQKIGVMGATGHSTGIHLHFEVYEDNQLKDPIDYVR
jgi:murein DD-endopeptidase MepM/ murein hydrolase activator NlpD